MPKIITGVYYPEPTIEVHGRYRDDVTLKQIFEIRDKAKFEQKHYLKKIRIEYNKRKDGIITHVIQESDEGSRRKLCITNKPWFDYSIVIFGSARTKKYKMFRLYSDGYWEDMLICPRAKHTL